MSRFATQKRSGSMLLMAMASHIEHCAPDKFIPYARNSRTHSNEQVAQIAASIKEFGAGIAVWTTNRVEIFFRQQLKASEPDQE